MSPVVRAYPATGEPPDSTSTEDIVAARFAAEDEARSRWLTAWLAREREEKAWKRPKAAGRRRVRTMHVRVDAVVMAVVG